MAKLFAIYQQPTDAAAFDDYYFSKHVPLAKTIPGLRGYEVTRGDVMGMGGKHGVYLEAPRWLRRRDRPRRPIWATSHPRAWMS